MSSIIPYIRQGIQTVVNDEFSKCFKVCSSSSPSMLYIYVYLPSCRVTSRLRGTGIFTCSYSGLLEWFFATPFFFPFVSSFSLSVNLCWSHCCLCYLCLSNTRPLVPSGNDSSVEILYPSLLNFEVGVFDAVKMSCSIFVLSWTAVIRYHVTGFNSFGTEYSIFFSSGSHSRSSTQSGESAVIRNLYL